MIGNAPTGTTAASVDCVVAVGGAFGGAFGGASFGAFAVFAGAAGGVARFMAKLLEM